jgi:hypothetical protein
MRYTIIHLPVSATSTLRGLIGVSSLLVSVSLPGITLFTESALAGDAIYTTNEDGTVVNEKQYASSPDVYLGGEPQNTNSAGLPDGTYYFQVTDPSGNTLLSSDIALCRQLSVSGGKIAGATGPACEHPNGIYNPSNGTTPVQLFPFSPTPNNGNEYKAWLIAQTANTSVSDSDPKVLIFAQSDTNTTTSRSKVRSPHHHRALA